MAARYPSYVLQDSPDGGRKEAELSGKPPKNEVFGYSVRQGFVNECMPHIQLSDIARNAEIDVIWEKWQSALGPLLERLNETLDEAWEEWEVPREPQDDWPAEARELHANGGRRGTNGRRRLTPRSRAMPRSNTSSTALTRTEAKSG